MKRTIDAEPNAMTTNKTPATGSMATGTLTTGSMAIGDLPPAAAGGGTLPPEARAELARALAMLHGGGRLARAAGAVARMAGFAAAPLMRLGARAAGITGAHGLPGRAVLQPVIEATMAKAFDVAVIALDETERFATPGRARFAAAVSGAAGGALGLPGFLPDAAFTTMLILRNIASIAKEEGEDLSLESTRRACLEVFTFGAPTQRQPAPVGGLRTAFTEETAAHDPAGPRQPFAGEPEGADSEGGYWGARLVLQGSPIVKLMSEAAARFGLVLSEKLALQVVPIAGAAGGALVNTAFLDHYRALAKGHFAIRRLERLYGASQVRESAATLGS